MANVPGMIAISQAKSAPQKSGKSVEGSGVRNTAAPESSKEKKTGAPKLSSFSDVMKTAGDAAESAYNRENPKANDKFSLRKLRQSKRVPLGTSGRQNLKESVTKMTGKLPQIRRDRKDKAVNTSVVPGSETPPLLSDVIREAAAHRQSSAVKTLSLSGKNVSGPGKLQQSGELHKKRSRGVSFKSSAGKSSVLLPESKISHAPRVEVQDNRTEKHADSQGNKESKETLHGLRQGSSRKTVKSKSGDAVRMESGFGERLAVSETEIEISKKDAHRPLQRNAAEQLARKLDSQAGNDIVKQVRVVLNRANAGEIRINLRPGDLGRVRLRLHLEDNRLTGRIFVESAAAREAFRNTLAGLQARLVESGFSAADLELFMDDGNRGFPQENPQKRNNDTDSNKAAEDFERMAGIVFGDSAGDGRVNLVV